MRRKHWPSLQELGIAHTTSKFAWARKRPTCWTGIDAIVVSPGVPQDIPLLATARTRSIPLTSETRLFAQQCPAPILGITGSSGKTTTTTLVARMMEAAGFRTWLGGNIGSPLLGQMSKTSNPQTESSWSFPASNYSTGLNNRRISGDIPWDDASGISPHIAAVLNVTPNHLDRHPSMSHYTAAKAHILAYQTETDIAVLSRTTSC